MSARPVDRPTHVFTVFPSPLSRPCTSTPSSLACNSNEHTGNLVVTYAWATRVLSGESSLSLAVLARVYTSSRHPTPVCVCVQRVQPRFVFWVKAGAAVALKNNGNKRGRPARVLAQGSHGHGGHVSQNVVSYMYTVLLAGRASFMYTPTPIIPPPALVRLPRRCSTLETMCAPVTSIHPPSLRFPTYGARTDSLLWTFH